MEGRATRIARSMFCMTILICGVRICASVKCLDCVGKDCMGSFCEGDYCLMGTYTSRWGNDQWGEPKLVKGCIRGKMLERDIRNHCESADKDGKEVFTCFCDRDYCNSDKSIERLEKSVVDLITCVCSGAHCKGNTCVGEMCSYVVNGLTNEFEQGCVNASVPLVERRSMDSCMIPPITGAMHHTVSKDPHALLATESCVCGTNYCNSKKPETTVPDRMKCTSVVTLEVLGTRVSSRNVTCRGEYCFKAGIKSKLGPMSEYRTMGCASFLDGAQLAEEMQPTGCAKFDSEMLDVETCFHTDDDRAVGRARANQESVAPRRKDKQKNRKPFERTTPPMKVEVDYEDENNDGQDEDENDDREENDDDRFEEDYEKEPKETPEKPKSDVTDRTTSTDEEKDQQKSKESVDDEVTSENESDEENDEKNDKKTSAMFIFERPTEPPIPDDSDVTLVTVFVLLMIIILMAGAVWKFQLHKRLFRSSYDTVAGG